MEGFFFFASVPREAVTPRTHWVIRQLRTLKLERSHRHKSDATIVYFLAWVVVTYGTLDLDEDGKPPLLYCSTGMDVGPWEPELEVE
jgi:hypothetical protein